MMPFYESNKNNTYPTTTNISCFWCTETFTCRPISLPIKFENNVFYVDGCFCSPECAAAYNFDTCNTTEVWERYFTDTGLFKIYDLKIKNKMHVKPGLRMTLDYPEDLEFLKKIFNELYDRNNNFNLTDIIRLLNKKPSLININKECSKRWNKKYSKEAEIKIQKKIQFKKNFKKYKKFSEYVLS